MSVKLEPCPFCNGEAEGDQCRGFVNYKGKSANAVAVYCTNCEAEISICYDDFPEYTPEHLMEMVVERWNKRDSLRTRLQQVESERDKAEADAAVMRDALDSAWACIWDGQLSGKGVTKEYAQAVSSEIKKAQATNAGKPLMLRLQEAERLLRGLARKVRRVEWNYYQGAGHDEIVLNVDEACELKAWHDTFLNPKTQDVM